MKLAARVPVFGLMFVLNTAHTFIHDTKCAGADPPRQASSSLLTGT